MQTVTVTAASTSARWGEIDANLDKAIAAAEQAAEENSRLLLLPECCLTGGDWPTAARSPRVAEVALELGGPEIRKICAVARRTGLVIAPGFYERVGGAIRVSQALVGPQGLIGLCRKAHEGSRSSTDAEPFPVFDLGFARVGISICRDNALPECARILALKGAEILLAPFMSLPLSRRAWRLERLVGLRARAQDNRLFVVSASHAMRHVSGKPGEFGYSGICCAVNPLGEVIGESNGRVGHPQHLTVTLDEVDQRTYLLAHVPGIRDRRPEAYGELADPALQAEYIRRHAAPFRYRETADRITIEPDG